MKENLKLFWQLLAFFCALVNIIVFALIAYQFFHYFTTTKFVSSKVEKPAETGIVLESLSIEFDRAISGNDAVVKILVASDGPLQGMLELLERPKVRLTFTDPVDVAQLEAGDRGFVFCRVTGETFENLRVDHCRLSRIFNSWY